MVGARTSERGLQECVLIGRVLIVLSGQLVLAIFHAVIRQIIAMILKQRKPLTVFTTSELIQQRHFQNPRQKPLQVNVKLRKF